MQRQRDSWPLVVPFSRLRRWILGKRDGQVRSDRGAVFLSAQAFRFQYDNAGENFLASMNFKLTHYRQRDRMDRARSSRYHHVFALRHALSSCSEIMRRGEPWQGKSILLYRISPGGGAPA